MQFLSKIFFLSATLLAAFSPVSAQSDKEKDKVLEAVFRFALTPYNKKRHTKRQPHPLTIRPLQLPAKKRQKIYYDVVLLDLYASSNEDSAVERRLAKRLSDLIIPVKANEDQVAIRSIGKRPFMMSLVEFNWDNTKQATVDISTHFFEDEQINDFRWYRVAKQHGVWHVLPEN